MVEFVGRTSEKRVRFQVPTKFEGQNFHEPIADNNSLQTKFESIFLPENVRSSRPQLLQTGDKRSRLRNSSHIAGCSACLKFKQLMLQNKMKDPSCAIQLCEEPSPEKALVVLKVHLPLRFIKAKVFKKTSKYKASLFKDFRHWMNTSESLQRSKRFKGLQNVIHWLNRNSRMPISQRS